MLSDDERQALPDPMRVAGMENLSERFTADQLREYGWACERAAYERAAQACEACENRVVKTHPARIEFDPDSMMARKCAAAIRALGRQHD